MASARQRPTPARRQASKQEPPRQSQAYHRRQELARAEREQRRITIGALAVLGVVLVMVTGAYLALDFLPRHAQVLSVGTARFDGDTAARRSVLLGLWGDDLFRADVGRDPVAGTLDALTREEILVQAGAGQVDPITDDDVQAAIRKRLGMKPDTPKLQFDYGYGLVLKILPVTKSVVEGSMRASAIADKMATKFATALPKNGAQVHLLSVSSPTKSDVQQVADAVRGGAKFGEAAVKAGIARASDAPDIGWVAVGDVTQVDAAIRPLKAGQTSDVVQLRNGDWVIYQAVERDDQREYTDDQRTQVGRGQVISWVEGQQGALKVQRSLSSSEAGWIKKEALRLGQQYQAAQAQQIQAGAPAQ